MMDFSRHVGLPWQDRGRGPDGWDCWGLVVRFYEMEMGVALPPMTDAYVSSLDVEASTALLTGGAAGCPEIASGEEAPGDIVLLLDGGLPAHVGVVERPGRMLHMPLRSPSRIERYRGVPWGSRVAGFYRPGAMYARSAA